MRFGILLFDGCEELDVFAPWDALNAARQFGADFEVAMGTAEARPETRMAFGTRLEAPKILDPKSGDWLLVPGGGWVARAAQGVRAEIQTGKLPARLAEWKRQGVGIASVCTGALLVAAAGISKGRPATTHHGARADLAATGALVVAARVVDDGDLISAGGVSSGIDLGLWLTERFAGADIAKQVRDYLEYPFPADLRLGSEAN